MPNPEFYKHQGRKPTTLEWWVVHQILGMFKDDQIINVHVKIQGMELQFLKRCSAFYREFKTTTKAYGKVTGIYAMRVALMLPNITSMEIWLEND